MKKITFLLFAFLLANLLTFGADFTVTGSFPDNSWNNAAADYHMSEIGTTGIYSLQKTLPAGSYEYKVFNTGAWTGPTEGDNRVFVLSAETAVTFYAKEDGSNIRFFSDAQQLFVIGSSVGGWESVNMQAMTNSTTDATYTADVISGEYKIVCLDKNGDIVWSDISSDNQTISGSGNYTIKLDFAPFEVSSASNGETTPSLVSIGNSYIFVGENPASAQWYNGSATYQSENFNGLDLGSVTSPIYIGGEVTTTPVLEGVTTKIGYQIDDMDVKEITLPYDSDNGTESTKWKSTSGVNVFSGYTLNNAQTYSLKLWFYATDGTSTLYDSNDGANYIATFTYDISTNNQPITSSTHITLKNQTIYATFEGSAQIALYSMNGQLIDSRLVHENYSMQLAKGVYILKINSEVQKIVVR